MYNSSKNSEILSIKILKIQCKYENDKLIKYDYITIHGKLISL